MDLKNKLVIINGTDKTDLITYCTFSKKRYHIYFRNQKRMFFYNENEVEILDPICEIDSKDITIIIHNKRISGIDKLLDFGAFYKIIRNGQKDLSFPKNEITAITTPKQEAAMQNVFAYFKEIAMAVGLISENNFNILSGHYEKISSIHPETPLYSFLNPHSPPQTRTPPALLIYPFGINASQKTAVEHAFSSQVSLIQGPPGTGKTQTILNIIANAVNQHKTIAVVSSNNSATKNIAEKLEKKQLNFICASLGNRDNKEKFFENQTEFYTDLTSWNIQPDQKNILCEKVAQLSSSLDRMLENRNRIAEIEQCLFQLQAEETHFKEYLSAQKPLEFHFPSSLSSENISALLVEYTQLYEQHPKLNFFQKILILFRHHYTIYKLFCLPPESVIPYLQKQFYIAKRHELTEEKCSLEQSLSQNNFTDTLKALSNTSMRLFKASLAKRYFQEKRTQFTMPQIRYASSNFCEEYPVILSTAYSIKGCLSPEYLYDYLVIDESSQVDLATGVLALSCAKNIVIVGDLKQLSNVISSATQKKTEKIWNHFNLDEMYSFHHHSLLSAAVERWPGAPSTLLREHYRCHPKIIEFCNQKFYGGQLIPMTKDHGEPDALMLFHTVPGNYTRGHRNKRQIDIIQKEILPHLHTYKDSDIGIITPYLDQVETLKQRFGNRYEIDTVHKFQGREKGAIILTSVDHTISDFVNNPNLLNVVISRAIHSLSVVVSDNPDNEKTNYGDLERYICYYQGKIINSAVFSVFDLLHKEFSEKRKVYLKKHRRVSNYDSENLLYSVLETILQKPAFSSLDCVIHFPLFSLIRNYDSLTLEEIKYVKNPFTHTDFLLYRKIDRSPVLAIEVDGVHYHQPGTIQEIRDQKKDAIFTKCNLPLLRIRTDESGEQEQIENLLYKILYPSESHKREDIPTEKIHWEKF